MKIIEDLDINVFPVIAHSLLSKILVELNKQTVLIAQLPYQHTLTEKIKENEEEIEVAKKGINCFKVFLN